MPHPARCGTNTQITGMSAVAATSVWATAWCGGGGGPEFGYVLHWDGNAWTVASRAPAASSSQLLGIQARDDHDVWVVGEYVHGSPSVESGLTLHYDGTSWSAPVAAPGSVRLDGVARGASGAWSVGDQAEAPFAPPWSGRFGGGAWHARPVRIQYGSLAAITTDPAGRVWAVGSQDDAGADAALVLTR